MTELTHGSLFAGIGGFDLGFERVGIETVWTVENDKSCNAILEKHWPNIKRWEDVKDVGKRNLEPVDIISGGFPCQDLSVAGRREGLAGERSGLWFEFARIIEEMEASWVVVENVPGLFSSNEGRDFAEIIQALEQFGYCVAWRVLDSQYFGVPQRRRRVFIVGSLGNGGSIEVLFEADGNLLEAMERGLVSYNLTARGPVDSSGGRARQIVIGTLKAAGAHTMSGIGYIATMGGAREWIGQNSCPESEASTPSQNSLLGGCCKRLDALDTGCIGESSRLTLPIPEGKLPSSLTRASGMDAPNTSNCQRPIGSSGEPKSTAIGKETNKPPKSLRTLDGESFGYGDISLRTSTPREWECLQGFPDGWTEGLSDTGRYKTLGNAVTVNVVEWIGQRLRQVNDG